MNHLISRTVEKTSLRFVAPSGFPNRIELNTKALQFAQQISNRIKEVNRCDEIDKMMNEKDD